MHVSNPFPSFVPLASLPIPDDEKKEESTPLHGLNPQKWSLQTQIGLVLACFAPSPAISIKVGAIALTVLMAGPKVLSYYLSSRVSKKQSEALGQPRLKICMSHPELHPQELLGRAFHWFKENEKSPEVLSMQVECPFMWRIEEPSAHRILKDVYDFTIHNHNEQIVDFHVTQTRALQTLTYWQSTLPALIKKCAQSQEAKKQLINQCQRAIQKQFRRRHQDLLGSLHDLYETLSAISTRPQLPPELIQKMNHILKAAIFNYMYVRTKNQNAIPRAIEDLLKNWDKIVQSCSDSTCPGFFTHSFKALGDVLIPSKTDPKLIEITHNFYILNAQPRHSPEELLNEKFQWFKEHRQSIEIESMQEECPLTWLIDASSKENQKESICALNLMIAYNTHIEEFHEVFIKALSTAEEAFSKWESSLSHTLHIHETNYKKEKAPFLSLEEARKQLAIHCQHTLTQHTRWLEHMLLNAVKRLYKKLPRLLERPYGSHPYLTQKIHHALNQSVYHYLCISSRNHVLSSQVIPHLLNKWKDILTSCQRPHCSRALAYLTPIEI